MALLMVSFAVHFAKALDSGRRLPRPVATRAMLLASLLAKRATAHNIGAVDLERLLRAQILWSLPIHRPVDVPPDSVLPDMDKLAA